MAPKRRALWEALLKHAGPRVPVRDWPTPTTHAFWRMSGGLKQTVESAVGRATEGGSVQDWEWTPHKLMFTFNVRIVIASNITDTVVNTTSRFFFNPRRAWAGEVERVMIEAEAHARKLRVALTQ